MKTVAGLLLRAGWAPVLVVVLHGLFARATNVYDTFSFSDMPMHFFGGMAIAYFLSSCFQAIPAGAISRDWRPVMEFITVTGMTATVAVLWEFVEYFSDEWFGTIALGNIYDTLQDLALGLAGALTWMTIVWLLGALGRVRPVSG